MKPQEVLDGIRHGLVEEQKRLATLLENLETMKKEVPVLRKRVRKAEKLMRQVAETFGLMLPPDVVPAASKPKPEGIEVSEDEFACDECEGPVRRTFASAQGLAVHRGRVHGGD